MFGVAAVGPGLRLGHTRTLTRTISKANRKVKQLLRRPVRALTCRCADYRISGIGNWLFQVARSSQWPPPIFATEYLPRVGRLLQVSTAGSQLTVLLDRYL